MACEAIRKGSGKLHRPWERTMHLVASSENEKESPVLSAFTPVEINTRLKRVSPRESVVQDVRNNTKSLQSFKNKFFRPDIFLTTELLRTPLTATVRPNNAAPVQLTVIPSEASTSSDESTTVITERPTRRPVAEVKPRPKKNKPCDTCGKNFSNLGQLKAHKRVHTGEKPYPCDFVNSKNEKCTSAFARNEELTRHRRTHTGEKPHSCRYCKKKFGRKDHLQKHMNIHIKNAAIQQEQRTRQEQKRIIDIMQQHLPNRGGFPPFLPHAVPHFPLYVPFPPVPWHHAMVNKLTAVPHHL